MRQDGNVGERNGYSKLTAEQVIAIRDSLGSSRIVAKMYGVEKTVVQRIRRGEAWRHISKPQQSAVVQIEEPLTAEMLRSLLSYDPETGEFRWRISRGRVSVGDIAGSHPNRVGYLRIMLGDVEYRAHRLAWLYIYGKWPELVIDHIDRNKTNNRIANLRDVSHAENMRNR